MRIAHRPSGGWPKPEIDYSWTAPPRSSTGIPRKTAHPKSVRFCNPLFTSPAHLRGCRNQRGMTMTKFLKLIRDKKGATAIEYGLIAALIAVAAIAAMDNIGSQLGETFNNVATELENG